MKMSLLSILTIIFVIFKLLGTITWSWWIVLSPAIACLAIGLIVIVFAIIVAAKG